MRPLNPVLRRELKERMRTRRTGVVLTVYLTVLAIVLYALYTNAEHRPFGGWDPSSTANVGRGMFETLLFAVLLLVCFLVPGYTAGAIVGERERQTMIPMQVTLLSPRSIVWGKLLASLAYLSLLVAATIPLLAVSFVFGGVTLAEMLKGVGMTVATGVVLATISLACSSFARRAQAATVLAYGITLLLLGGTFAAYGLEATMSTSHGEHNKAVLALNPIVATADAVAGKADSTGNSSPLSRLSSFAHRGSTVFSNAVAVPSSAVAVDTNGGGFVSDGSSFSAGPGPLPQPIGVSPNRTPYAAYSLVCFALLALLSFALAVRRTTAPAASDRT